ncbi:MAG: hypothetical protein IPP45_15160 [Sphingomonadales bacterium]|nr:hypothetical protein [Sphingomonadales bacterium]
MNLNECSGWIWFAVLDGFPWRIIAVILLQNHRVPFVPEMPPVLIGPVRAWGISF